MELIDRGHRHLAALERAGQVVAEPDPSDSRTFLVRQTDEGRAEIATTIEAGAAVFSEVIADWPDRDVTTALELVTRLNQARAESGGTVTSPPGTGPRWRRARDSEGEQ